jgi:ribosome-binding protein aMBF1 (putative translation factor)
MDHQDWETHIVHCKVPKNKSSDKNNNNKVPRNSLPKNDTARKLDEKVENGESLTHKKVNSDLKKEFQKWRQSKSFTQKQVAQKLNVQPSIINDFESGKLNHNPKLVGQIKRLIKT